jgi:surface protein
MTVATVATLGGEDIAIDFPDTTNRPNAFPSTEDGGGDSELGEELVVSAPCKKTFATREELSCAVRDWCMKVNGGDNCPTMAEAAAQAKAKAKAKARCLQRYGHIRYWDVSAVNTMKGLFDGRKLNDADDDDDDLSRWDTSSVTDMSYMFANLGCSAAEVGNWDVSKVTNMEGMFMCSPDFGGDLRRWDVSNVTNTNGMFLQASDFDSDLSGWDVSRVTDMRNMFSDAHSFTGGIGGISGWDVSRVTLMNNMFEGAARFDCDLNGWDTSSVTDMCNMFARASRFSRRPRWLSGPAQHQRYAADQLSPVVR